jgi:hypothetical protein
VSQTKFHQKQANTSTHFNPISSNNESEINKSDIVNPYKAVIVCEKPVSHFANRPQTAGKSRKRGFKDNVSQNRRSSPKKSLTFKTYLQSKDNLKEQEAREKDT